MQQTEHTFTSWDGTELFYRAWWPDGETRPKRGLLLFHRGHEHSGRWDEMVRALGLEGVAVFAWDQRGHGHSPGERGYAKELAHVVWDAEAWARHIAAAHGIAVDDMAVVAHSVGAVIAAAWVHDFAPPIRGMVLGAPAFRVKLYVPFALPALRFKQKMIGPGVVKSYVKAKMITHDAEQARAYDADPLIFRQIAVNVLIDLYDLSTRLLEDAGAITTPTLVLAAEKEWVVKIPAQRRFYERLGSTVKRFELLPGMYHAIFQEKGREALFAKVRDFLRECFARPVQRGELLAADQRGYTHDEYERLRQGAGGARWAATRGFMKSVGRLSDGIALGWRAGFDSGVMLDYVYENQPRGRTPIGRLIDRQYLGAIGWRGIRGRRQNLRKVLARRLRLTLADWRPVHIIDIAAGAGRYVLETMKELGDVPASATLRDYKEENLAAARKLAAELGLAKVTIKHGDAFDRTSLAALSPRPTIAITSGIYELFPDNEPVLRSLRGLADAMEAGGVLIYTCQPYHPQLEFIARVLVNHAGRPWVMRRRSQAEMDELVRAAGFAKVAQEVDAWGMFSVSVAKRVENA